MSKKNEGFVEATVGGRDYKGEWNVEGGLITVRYAMEHETTQLGNEPWPPIRLAKLLLVELVDRYNSRAR